MLLMVKIAHTTGKAFWVYHGHIVMLRHESGVQPMEKVIWILCDPCLQPEVSNCILYAILPNGQIIRGLNDRNIMFHLSSPNLWGT